MKEPGSEREMLVAAMSGDKAALHHWLLDRYDWLAQHITGKIPSSVRGVISEDDILQQTYVQVIRDIGRFSPRTARSFEAWVKRVAENRTQDAIRHLTAKKRGGERQQVHSVGGWNDDSMADLVDMLSAGSNTPSGSAARHETITAIQDAMDALPDDYRQAVQLHLLSGKSLKETAAIMRRSPRAVQGLLDRAKKKMRDVLGRLSLYE